MSGLTKRGYPGLGCAWKFKVLLGEEESRGFQRENIPKKMRRNLYRFGDGKFSPKLSTGCLWIVGVVWSAGWKRMGQAAMECFSDTLIFESHEACHA